MKNSSMKNFLQEMYNNNKSKSENTIILCVLYINCTCKLTCVCASAWACDCTHLREQYEEVVFTKCNDVTKPNGDRLYGLLSRSCFTKGNFTKPNGEVPYQGLF